MSYSSLSVARPLLSRCVAGALLAVGACGRAPLPHAAPPAPPATLALAHAAAQRPGEGAPPSLPTPHLPQAPPEQASPEPPCLPTASALDELRRDVMAADSASLLVMLRDEVVLDDYAGRRPPVVELMSITKTVVALAVGALIQAGRLELERLVADDFPSWRGGARGEVRLRHLLSHTSGLGAEVSTAPLYAARDLVAEALAAPLLHAPGERFAYSNRGANLVAAMAARAAGEPLERYVARTLFQPLDITRYEWRKDALGNTFGFAGLKLDAPSLAKLGRLVTQAGRWNDHQVVSPGFLAEATRPSAAAQPRDKGAGLFFWVVASESHGVFDAPHRAELAQAGVPAPLLERLTETLEGHVFGSRAELGRTLLQQLGLEQRQVLYRSLAVTGLPAVRWTFGEPIGWYSAGSLGQWLVALPRHQLLAVRQRRRPTTPTLPTDEELGLPDFIERVRALCEAPRRPTPTPASARQ